MLNNETNSEDINFHQIESGSNLDKCPDVKEFLLARAQDLLMEDKLKFSQIVECIKSNSNKEIFQILKSTK